ncbi:hypothetical protein DAKH74_058210 [Maudiozyma humilis]|uniref:Uncharacterized protein n=1 Tax=Maudiozyma humilis TaxID=51915 RepID=A0AAV5S5P2_MAUHU|nr:hypothetical protein DAKH74_058210 [Kazachstania humilis]
MFAPNVTISMKMTDKHPHSSFRCMILQTSHSYSFGTGDTNCDTTHTPISECSVPHIQLIIGRLLLPDPLFLLFPAEPDSSEASLELPALAPVPGCVNVNPWDGVELPALAPVPGCVNVNPWDGVELPKFKLLTEFCKELTSGEAGASPADDAVALPPAANGFPGAAAAAVLPPELEPLVALAVVLPASWSIRRASTAVYALASFMSSCVLLSSFQL